MAEASDAERAAFILKLAQTMNASQCDRDVWIESQEKLIEQMEL